MIVEGDPTRGRIIDAHCHVDGRAGGLWVHGPELLLRRMAEAGVERAVIMTYTDAPHDGGGTQYIAGVVGQYPERFVGYIRVNPRAGSEAVAAVEEAVSTYHMRGVKIHPVTTLDHPASPTTTAVVETAARLNVPVLFHCGDEPLTTPFAIEGVAKNVPDAKIILGHMGGYRHTEDAVVVAMRNANVWLETSAMPYPRVIRDAVQRLGPWRILFGSDGPGCRARLEVLKVKRAGLSDSALCAVLRMNWLRLHGEGGSA